MRRRTRILILIKGLGLGGAEMLLINAAPYLDRDQFDYRIGYFLPWKDALHKRLEAAGLPVHCFNIPRSVSVSGLLKLRTYLRQSECDILHMHLPIPGVLGRLAGRWAGVHGLVYTEHNVWPRIHPVSRFANRLTYSLNDAVIAVSEEVKRSIRASSPSVMTIENGIHCDPADGNVTDRAVTRRELNIGDDAIVIVKVANLTPKKNHAMLLTAFRTVQQRIPEAYLLLVGQFADRHLDLARRADELGIASNMCFAGPRADIPAILRASDVFAMSSQFEGMPIALLEAMAAGLPSVCTGVGGIPDVVRDGVDGFVVAPNDVAGLANKLIDICLNKSLRQQLGASSAVRVRSRFNIATMVRRVEDVYRRVLKDANSESAALLPLDERKQHT